MGGCIGEIVWATIDEPASADSVRISVSTWSSSPYAHECVDLETRYENVEPGHARPAIDMETEIV